MSSSSLVEVKVEFKVGVGVEVEDEVGIEVVVGKILFSHQGQKTTF